MAQLCREHGIARNTGYKWVQRLLNGGVPALLDRSRAPLTHPNAVADEVIDAIVALRKQRPTWGPKKLRARLCRDQPKVTWPSEGTFARILRRHGLAQPKRRMRRTPVSEHRLAVPREPSDVWCADYKGKFRVDGKYCHPLTISDACSRFLLCCQDTGGERQEPTQLAFEKAFKEFGLPLRIRTDNGVPFASTSLGGLSKLSVWWIKLGILPERTRPAHPQDNGLHERMHRTLKADTAKPPRSSLARQQQCFDVWRHDFNHQRPHEALDMRVPADVYAPSPRAMPDVVPDPEYPGHFELCRVYSNGHMRFGHHRVDAGRVLAAPQNSLFSFSALRGSAWAMLKRGRASCRCWRGSGGAPSRLTRPRGPWPSATQPRRRPAPV